MLCGSYLPNEITRPILGIEAAMITRIISRLIETTNELFELTSNENKTNAKSMFVFIDSIFTVFRKNFSTYARPEKSVWNIELQIICQKDCHCIHDLRKLI